MTPRLAFLLAAAALGACARQTPPNASVPATARTSQATTETGVAEEHHAHMMPGMAPVEVPDNALFTAADVHFMQGMIAHHAQAVHMTRLAEAAGAGPRVLKLAQKIDLSQAGEIALMQGWLRDHRQFAPDTSAWRTMSMPGMLTPDELTRLEAARGTDFDRLFLRLMIKHHEGAIKMVADLMATPRAAQDVDVSVLANDVENTQLAEIGLMWQMLAELDQ
ncbi:MAG: DUF305 domain-containing protein [Gemmatimonadaceae bacterium]|nr:DUF305 domain-containing protein [Gemmatimonadaceae bacterium]